ncbi:monovalent cation:H+ antiporter, CPA1 (nhx1) [Batrachochytrium dendrobatidis]|nr:monovalent cation:H+ antiporter, CPA1 (nhx1) [Batrachochytrium dendrobatidis]
MHQILQTTSAFVQVAMSTTNDPTTSTQPNLPSLPSHTPLPATQEEVSTSWALLILVSILVCILLTSYYLQRRQIRFIHETVVSIFLGSLVGAVIRFSPAGTGGIKEMVTFDHRYFFNLLLPPIIFNSGYDMKRRNFFKNFGSILIFAFCGTFISTTVIGVLIFAIVSVGMPGLDMTFLDCFVFGAILSSTDPVTILSIFHQMKVDPKLFAIIFGESILNDSVAIVLFSTLGKFQGKSLTLLTLLHGIGSFLGVFFGSVLIGIIIALMCALMLKHTQLHLYSSLESCLITLLAYSSYLLSNAIQLSGIVSLLFCGITLKHYAYDNMSIRSRRTTKYMFRVLSQMSENFVFIYLGVALFTQTDQAYYPVLILLTLVVIMFARYVSTIPLAKLINVVSRRWGSHKRVRRLGVVRNASTRQESDAHDQPLDDILEFPRTRGDTVNDMIPRNHQLMIWWAGLRGAIAFALAFNVEGKAGPVVRTTTLVVCVVSIVLLGGTTHLALERLHICTGVSTKIARSGNSRGGMIRLSDGVVAESDTSEEEDEQMSVGEQHRRRYIRHDPPRSEDAHNTLEQDYEYDLPVHQSTDSLDFGFNHHDDQVSNHWFLSFDAQWLKPLFTQSGWRRSPVSRGNNVERFSVEHRPSESSSPTRQPLLSSSGADICDERHGNLEPSASTSPSLNLSTNSARRIFGNQNLKPALISLPDISMPKINLRVLSQRDTSDSVAFTGTGSTSASSHQSIGTDRLNHASVSTSSLSGVGRNTSAADSPTRPFGTARAHLPTKADAATRSVQPMHHGDGTTTPLVLPAAQHEKHIGLGTLFGGNVFMHTAVENESGITATTSTCRASGVGGFGSNDDEDTFLDVNGTSWKPKK